eukprot:70841_1
MGCCNKAERIQKSRTMANERQPGSIDSIKAESFHVQRTSTKNLDMNEEDDDGEVDDSKSITVTEIDDAQAPEREGEEIILNRQESGETDKHVAVSAKPDTSSARTQGEGGDGEWIDEVRQWVESTGFIEYYDNFVKNGMNDLELIKTIENKDDLAYLGIELKGHQIAMMKKIKELKTGKGTNLNLYHTPQDSAAQLELDLDLERNDQNIEHKEDIVLDNMLSEVLEMQKAPLDKIHQMNADASDDVSDSDDSDNMYQKSENRQIK